MVTKLVSYDRLERVLGRPDKPEESTNQGNLRAAKAVIREAMGKELTERQRECVRLYFFEGLTEEETGLALGVGKSTVCRHLKKAKERLRRAASYAGTACRAFPPLD